jgi:hypothetical protein
MTDEIQAALVGLGRAESRGVVMIFAKGPASSEASVTAKPGSTRTSAR